MCGTVINKSDASKRSLIFFFEILNNIRIGKAIESDVTLIANTKTNTDEVGTCTTIALAENYPKNISNLTNLPNLIPIVK